MQESKTERADHLPKKESYPQFQENSRYDPHIKIGSKPAMFSKKVIDRERGIKVHN